MIRYENSFMWFSDAGVALRSFNVTEPQAPLQLNEKRNLFKLFMGDTGLLCASCMENIQFELLQGNMDVNMGKCIHCGKCTHVCPMDVDPVKTPDSAECIRCGKCVSACPKKALKLGIR